MPFNDNLPAQGTQPWYTPFNTAWTNLKTFINGLEVNVSDVELDIVNHQTQIDELEPGGDVSWDSVTGKPTTYPPSAHNQDISTINGLDAALAAKAAQADLEAFEIQALGE